MEAGYEENMRKFKVERKRERVREREGQRDVLQGGD